MASFGSKQPSRCFSDPADAILCCDGAKRIAIRLMKLPCDMKSDRSTYRCSQIHAERRVAKSPMLMNVNLAERHHCAITVDRFHQVNFVDLLQD